MNPPQCTRRVFFKSAASKLTTMMWAFHLYAMLTVLEIVNCGEIFAVVGDHCVTVRIPLIPVNTFDFFQGVLYGWFWDIMNRVVRHLYAFRTTCLIISQSSIQIIAVNCIANTEVAWKISNDQVAGHNQLSSHFITYT